MLAALILSQPLSCHQPLRITTMAGCRELLPRYPAHTGCDGDIDFSYPLWNVVRIAIAVRVFPEIHEHGTKRPRQHASIEWGVAGNADAQAQHRVAELV